MYYVVEMMTDLFERARMLILRVLEPLQRLREKAEEFWEEAEDRRIAVYRLKNPDRRVILRELERELEGG